MIKGVLFLQSGSLFSGGNFLNTLEQLGFFNYVLPFLLIFALVFGILTKMQLFRDNKAINAIIALAVGLMALQFDIVSTFFSQIFPKVGIGLVVILAVIVLLGLFLPSQKNNVINVILFVIGFTILIVVLVTSFPQFNLGLDGFLQQYGITILVIAAAIGAVVIIIGFSKPKKNNKFDFPNPIILPSGNGS